VSAEDVDDQPWAGATGEFFSGWAESGRGERMAQGHARLVEVCLDRLQLDGDSRLLDVGCGVGRALQRAKERASCAALAGVDVAEAMIQEARSLLPEADLQVASADGLPFADGAFSHLLSVEAIYYFQDPLASFRELHRVLAPGARVALGLELFAENRGSHAWRDALEIPVHLLSSEAWSEHLRAAGFSEVRAERIHCHDDKEWSGPSPYFPSRELHAAYVEAGALLLLAEKA
jgi:arsenite methyltransferase